ncbi:MAG: YibE/F family protein [Microlunatus sp.]
MSHSHSTGPTTRRAGSTGRRGRSEAARHQQALRILIVVLIPLGIWTFAGLIALWPKDAASHINHDVAGYSVPGITYPTAEITAIQPVSCEGMAGSTPGANNQTCATISVRVLDGDDTGKEVAGIPLTDALYNSGTKIGQRVKLIRIPPTDGQPSQFQFSDFERRAPLIVITLAFAAAVIFVARWRGFASLLGLGFAGFILVKFMFPALVSGSNPVLVGLVGSSAIMFVVLYAAHGISARTSTALVGTLFGLVTAALLGWGATSWAHLSGITSEDDYVLAASAPDMSLTSVVICGVIVAGLGVLNDVTITQASAVWELADNDPDQKRLFSKAMRIGRDHIASTVYTIAFATAGASLPVFLLIAIYNRPLFEVLQTESFAAELIRTMVGSIGLILAVPLTTAVGVAVVRASGKAKLPGFRRRKPAPVPARAATGPTSTEYDADGDDADSGDTIVIANVSAEEAAPENSAEISAVAEDTDSKTESADDTAAIGPEASEAKTPESEKPKAADPEEPKAATKQTRLRRRRKSSDDDLDFSDLRDPD